MGSVTKLNALFEQLKKVGPKTKGAFEIRRQISLVHLDQSKSSPYRVDVKISAAPDSCPACIENHGKIISIEEAYSEMPVPNKHCTSDKGCRCRFVLLPRRKDDGKLDLK